MQKEKRSCLKFKLNKLSFFSTFKLTTYNFSTFNLQLSNLLMFIVPQNFDALFEDAKKDDLYQNLIEQINKDFNLANEGIDFPKSIPPNELKIQLHEKIYRLIQYKFAEYLNLLYIIDVSEAEIKKLDGSDLVQLAEDVSFLILKREWQKVWFRNKYK